MSNIKISFLCQMCLYYNKNTKTHVLHQVSTKTTSTIYNIHYVISTSNKKFQLDGNSEKILREFNNAIN